jgi:hypothetical protein
MFYCVYKTTSTPHTYHFFPGKKAQVLHWIKSLRESPAGKEAKPQKYPISKAKRLLFELLMGIFGTLSM